METAGGQYATAHHAFCYCIDEKGCGCSVRELWPASSVMPIGMSVQATYGTPGRFGISNDDICPAGTTRNSSRPGQSPGQSPSECIYNAGAYIYKEPSDNHHSLAVFSSRPPNAFNAA
jgi:hypothetical protein